MTIDQPKRGPMTDEPIEPTDDDDDAAAIPVGELPAGGGGADSSSDGPAKVGAREGDVVEVVDAATEDLAPPTYDAVLTFWADMFLSVAGDAATALENLDAVVEPAHRAAIVAVWNAIGATAMRGAATIGAWLDGVPADAPELVAAAEDPGDLTCPRCDGPIPLAQLRERGICAVCGAKEDAFLAGERDHMIDEAVS